MLGWFLPVQMRTLSLRKIWVLHRDCAVMCLLPQSCLTLCNPVDCSLPGSSVHWDSPGKNTGVGCHALLQGIFPTQGLSPGLPHCRQILYHLSHQGSRRKPLRLTFGRTARSLPRVVALFYHSDCEA